MRGLNQESEKRMRQQIYRWYGWLHQTLTKW